MKRVIIDPYREFNEAAFRDFDALSHEEKVDLLKEIGILDKRGNLAASYRPSPEPKSRPKSTKAPTKAAPHKRAAS